MWCMSHMLAGAVWAQRHASLTCARTTRPRQAPAPINCIGKHMTCASACAARRSSELVPSFLKLLRDGEAEVRVAAAGKVAAFCKLLGNDTVRRTPRPRPGCLPVLRLYASGKVAAS